MPASLPLDAVLELSAELLTQRAAATRAAFSAPARRRWFAHRASHCL
jgi:hypothetical protein